MYSSEIRINYISDYISAYESKIKLLNSEGLFDAATITIKKFSLAIRLMGYVSEMVLCMETIWKMR